VTESLVLAACGGVLGLVTAHWGKALFAASTLLAHDIDLRLHPGVLVATLLLSAMAGLGFGFVPAFSTMRQTRRGFAARAQRDRGSRSRFGRLLLVSQVAASVVLLVGAGLFVRTLGQWERIDTGFSHDNLLVFDLALERRGLDRQAVALLTDRLVQRIRAVPGVTDVTTSGSFWRDRWFGRPLIDGQEAGHSHDSRSVPRYLPVRDNFFDVLGLPVRAGRVFGPHENGRRPDAAVVDEQFVRQFFGDASPLGHRVALARKGPEVEIVGVVGTMWWPGTRPEEVVPRIFLSESMRETDFDPNADQWNIKYGLTETRSILVRAADPLSLVPALRAATQDITPDLPMLDPKTVTQGFGDRLAPTRIASLVWLSFAGVALVLTAMGLYGLLASAVAQRTQEIGVRAALGAGRFDIVRLVTGQTMWLVAIGIVVGLGLSIAGSQLVRAYLFGVPLHDPVTLASVVGLVGVVTFLAALQPTRRALRVDPAVALRWE
jgi:predicted permease